MTDFTITPASRGRVGLSSTPSHPSSPAGSTVARRRRILSGCPVDAALRRRSAGPDGTGDAAGPAAGRERASGAQAVAAQIRASHASASKAGPSPLDRATESVPRPRNGTTRRGDTPSGRHRNAAVGVQCRGRSSQGRRNRCARKPDRRRPKKATKQDRLPSKAQSKWPKNGGARSIRPPSSCTR